GGRWRRPYKKQAPRRDAALDRDPNSRSWSGQDVRPPWPASPSGFPLHPHRADEQESSDERGDADRAVRRGRRQVRAPEPFGGAEEGKDDAGRQERGRREIKERAGI